MESMDLALQGHSFLLTGLAGTGKSFSLVEIVTALRNNGRKVLVASSTGISCMPLIKISAKTVHSTFGLRDGRYSTAELLNRFDIDETYMSKKDLIINSHVMVIDEISMVSAYTLGQISDICCHVRGSREPFGGMQRIFVGDFHQLSPVPNIASGDTGTRCIDHDSFRRIVPHTVVLTEVKRQDEPELIQAVQQLSLGDLTPETEGFIRALDKPISKHSVQLHSLNHQADLENRFCLDDMAGEEFIYSSKDSGLQKDLNMIKAPKLLVLKKGCPVILIKNLTASLVNGLRGTVKNCTKATVAVHFAMINQTVSLQQTSFTRYDPALGRDVAERQQIPLSLGFALTIHKSQGMSLTRVHVNCRDIFAAGQLAVAIGRATNANGLSVCNFSPHKHVIKPPQDLMGKVRFSAPCMADLSCCRDLLDEGGYCGEGGDDRPLEPDDDPDEYDQELDDDSLSKIIAAATDDEDEKEDTEEDDGNEEPLSLEELENYVKGIEGQELNVTDLLDELKHPTEITDSQKEQNMAIQWLQNQQAKLEELLMMAKKELENIWTDQVTSNDSASFTKFFKQVHAYSQAPFKNLCTSKFGDNINREQQIILQKLFVSIRKICVKKFQEAQKESEAPTEVKFDLSASGRGKIRYLAGRCVAKARQHTIRIIRSNIHKKSQIKTLRKEKEKLNILSSMRVSYEMALAGSYPETLDEVNRRQRIGGGLTYVSDRVFELYLELEKRRVEMHTVQRLRFFRGQVLRESFHSLLTTSSIKELYDALVDEAPVDAETKEALFQELVGSYIRVSNNEFRKYLAVKLGKKKKKAHRKQIVEPSSTTSIKKRKLASDTVAEEAVPEKDPENLHVPSTSAEKPGTSYTTPDSQTSADMPGTSYTTPDSRMSAVSQSVPSRNEPEASEGEEKDYFCPECGKKYKGKGQWIGCDGCDTWHHRKCAGLSAPRMWKQFTETDIEWLCAKCQK